MNATGSITRRSKFGPTPLPPAEVRRRYLPIRLNEEEAAEIELAFKLEPGGEAFLASWARELVLAEARRIVGGGR